MARQPLLQLSDIRLGYGGDPIFAGADLVVQPGDRMALVGRNGSGKSTLMKVMLGAVEPDSGLRTVAQGIHVKYMDQEPDFKGCSTLGDFVRRSLGEDKAHLAVVAAEGLGLDLSLDAATASGGERRRAALAAALADDPDLLLLDEPTNHLDIAAITWLEDRLASGRSALIVISHDRAFLRALCPTTVWLDRGILRRADQPFDRFDEWRDKVWVEEDTSRHKLDRKIKAEARWAVEGISARRRRNQGRLRELAAMRSERAEMIRRQGTAAMALESGAKSGRMVIEAKGISKAFNGMTVVSDLTLTVNRGDRIGLVGPNGVGKTTLLKLLTTEIEPDEGSVRLGTNLSIARFDQSRDSLDPDANLGETLTGDPEIGAKGSSDQVMVRGQPRHIVGYLKDFLFDEARVRAPVRALSGGERARLLLARLMARESNLLVLDEPTNDLDVDTLDLLQEVLSDYPGTVLIVSHDRDFLDRTATACLVFEGNGRVVMNAGGWSDYAAPKKVPAREKPRERRVETPRNEKRNTGLSFTERHRLDALPDEIDRLSAEIAKLEKFLAQPGIFDREPAKFAKASDALAERMSARSAAENEWLALAERAEG